MIRTVGLDDRGPVIKAANGYQFRPVKRTLLRKGDRIEASFVPGPLGGHIVVTVDGHAELWQRSAVPMGRKKRAGPS